MMIFASSLLCVSIFLTVKDVKITGYLAIEKNELLINEESSVCKFNLQQSH
jgi:hypothetical protein